jgi:uncharacterized membrane protein YhaH (DUF805 family)
MHINVGGCECVWVIEPRSRCISGRPLFESPAFASTAVAASGLARLVASFFWQACAERRPRDRATRLWLGMLVAVPAMGGLLPACARVTEGFRGHYEPQTVEQQVRLVRLRRGNTGHFGESL